MALLSNAFHSFQATGNREDLTNLLSIISPKDTPLYDTLGGGNPLNGVNHEWQTDTLAAANADNAALEGETFTPGALTPTNRYGNYAVISLKQFRVTEIQEKVAKAGRGSEISYQKAKALAEIKNDFEAMLCTHGTAASAGAGSTTVPRRMSNVWFWTVKVTAHSGTSGINTGTSIATTLTGATITEVQFNDIVQNIWADGGRPNAVYVNGSLKRLVTGWGTSTSRVHEGGKKITNVVDVYEGDFTTLELKKERQIASSLGMILQESMWKKSVMIPIGEVEIARTGLAENKMLRQVWTIEARNPTANGVFISAP
jgi:hypothetical protein